MLCYYYDVVVVIIRLVRLLYVEARGRVRVVVDRLEVDKVSVSYVCACVLLLLLLL